MNSLIGLGAATSFTAGSASLLLPGAGLEVGFLEEPVMLLAFVLLGRALETRARLKASGMCASMLTACRLDCTRQWLLLVCHVNMSHEQKYVSWYQVSMLSVGCVTCVHL